VGGPALGRAGGGVPNLNETGDADAAGNSLPKLFLVRERPCECVVRLGVRASRVGDCATPAAARLLPASRPPAKSQAAAERRGDTSLPPDARGALAEAGPRAGGGGACWGGGGAESV
jgi:hypothetical protein